MKSTGDENIDNFIKHVREKAAIHGVKVCLYNRDRIKMGKNSYCGGYFSETELKISVAVNRPLSVWLSVLVHEFCHMEQWISNVKVWNSLYLYNTDSCIEFFDWLENKQDIHPDLIKYLCERVIDMEYDAEKRSVAKIKKFNLPIDIKDYIRKANCYMWFYTAVRLKRRWEGKDPKSSIYSTPKLVAMCPSTWMKDLYNPPAKFLKALDEYYF